VAARWARHSLVRDRPIQRHDPDPGDQRTVAAAAARDRACHRRPAFKVIRPVAGAVILLGFIRGTFFGQIQSLEALTTAYGITWLIGLAFAIGAYMWAERMVAPALEQMNAIPEAEALGPDGTPSPALESAIAVVKRNSVLELGFFLVIFTCMILMRFGL
jgi:hypothetical protein